MTAAQDAAQRIREGMAAPLAITVTAREYGMSTRAVARAMADRRAEARQARARMRQPAAWNAGGSWWNK